MMKYQKRIKFVPSHFQCLVTTLFAGALFLQRSIPAYTSPARLLEGRFSHQNVIYFQDSRGPSAHVYHRLSQDTAITRNSRKSRIRPQVNSELSFLALCTKNDNSEFFMTRGIMLGSENSEFRVIVFCPILKNDNSEFYFYIWDHAWK